MSSWTPKLKKLKKIIKIKLKNVEVRKQKLFLKEIWMNL